MILTIVPKEAPLLRPNELFLWLQPLCEELGLQPRIREGAAPEGTAARALSVEGRLIGWAEARGAARPAVVEAIATAIERAATDQDALRGLTRTSEAAKKELDFLYDLMPLLREVMELHEACRLIVRQLARTTEAERIALYLLEEGELVLRGSYPSGDRPSPPAVDASQRGEPTVSSDGDGCQICVPLVDSGQVVGALWLQGAHTLGRPAGLKFLKGVATLSAQAIMLRWLITREFEAAEMNRSLELAAQFQRGLMPSQAPSFPGVRLAGASRASHIIAGDAFDYMLHEAGLDLLVADVSGHGPAAGLLMASFLGMLRTIGTGNYALADAARLANRFVCREVDSSGHYVTALLARLEPGGRVLRYVSMGHASPLLWRRGQVVALPRPDGLPAGFREQGDFVEHVIALEPGDLVVMFTDGLTEARTPDGGFIGLNGLMAALGEAAPAGPEPVLAALFMACGMDTRAGAIADDQTAIVVQVL